MLSDNDREAIATVITFVTGASFVALGITGTLTYGWVRTMALTGTAMALFTAGCLMAHFAVRPLRRRTATPDPAPAPAPAPAPTTTPTP